MLRSAIFLLILLFLNACTPKTKVVLLENSEKDNAVVVSTKQGKVLIDKPYHSTMITGENNEPQKIETVSKERFLKTYETTLQSSAKKPLQFMLYFRHDSSDLTVESYRKIDRAIEGIKSRQPCIVDIIGHTDSMGDKKYNMFLSKQRMKKVKDVIESKKVKSLKLSTQYYGENIPLIKTKDGVSLAKNRRVEIMIR